MAKKLTDQEKQPHASLVQVRNCIEVACDCTRKQAAEIANNLNNSQCDSVVNADGDKTKTLAAIKTVKNQLKAESKAEETAPEEQAGAEPKTTTKTKSNRS